MGIPFCVLHGLPSILSKAIPCSLPMHSKLRLPPSPPSLLPFLCSSASSSLSADANHPHFSGKDPFAPCNMDTSAASGPAGLGRNNSRSAVRLKCVSTALLTQGVDCPLQHKNRVDILDLLRRQIASKVRRPVQLVGYTPPPELLRLLPASKRQREDVRKIGPNHPDFVPGLQALLDLLSATEGYVSNAATILGLSTGALSKLITSDKIILQATNELRASKGLKALH